MSNIPVITSNIGGMAELVQDGINGLLFQVGDSQDLAKKIQSVIDDTGSIEKREKIYCLLFQWKNLLWKSESTITT